MGDVYRRNLFDGGSIQEKTTHTYTTLRIVLVIIGEGHSIIKPVAGNHVKGVDTECQQGTVRSRCL